jgi:gliding motility-associated-like protein
MILEHSFSDTEIGLSVQLFDRYGKLITVLNQNQTWDGTLTVMNFVNRLLVYRN